MVMRVYLSVSMLISVTMLILPFFDSHYKHIITEDLQIIKNEKTRKLLIKGPSY